MYLESIYLKNIYNFGRQGTNDLKEFKKLNLFIGKNGSGKTNVFRAICALDLIPEYDEKSDQFTYLLGYKTRNWNAFEMGETISIRSELSINYRDQKILFVNDRHHYGNIHFYKGTLIGQNITKLCFENTLRKLLQAPHFSHILNFFLSYLFDLNFQTINNKIVEYFILQNNHEKTNQGKPITFDNWSSGFLSATNLIAKLLLSNSNVICIDEPETNIEPRALRRMFELFLWITSRSDNEIQTVIKIEHLFQKWCSSNIDPKENTELLEKIQTQTKKQLFISSHSPVLLNLFIQNNNQSSIYEFNRSYKDTSFQSPTIKNNKTVYELVKRKAIQSHVKKIQELPHSILDNIGAKGADILQTNGIIWVEGPSDIIYINKWLEMYAVENDYEIFIQGVNFEFQMYGGALLDSICILKHNDSYEELKKLTQMFSFSRNSFIVTDSDSIFNKKKEIIDQSNFKKAKEFIANQVEVLKKKEFNIDMWCPKLNTKIRTIEDYLDTYTKSNFKREQKKLSKKLFAEKVTKSWTKRKKLSSFKHALDDQIKILYELIHKWNT